MTVFEWNDEKSIHSNKHSLDVFYSTKMLKTHVTTFCCCFKNGKFFCEHNYLWFICEMTKRKTAKIVLQSEVIVSEKNNRNKMELHMRGVIDRRQQRIRFSFLSLSLSSSEVCSSTIVNEMK